MRKLLGVFMTLFAFLPLLLVDAQGPPKPMREQQAKDLVKDIRRDGGLLKSSKQVIDSLAAMRELSEQLRSFGLQQQLVTLTRFHRDPAVRREAARTLAEISRLSDQAPAVVEHLTKLIDEPDAELRAAALLAISRMVPNANAAMPKVLKAMKDDDARVRRAACIVIGQAVKYDKTLIPHLIAALDDPDMGNYKGSPGINSVSWQAITTLRRQDLTSHFRIEGKAGAKTLVKLIRSKNGSEKYELDALEALARIAPEEPLTLNRAQEWIQSKDDFERVVKGAGLLRVLGPHGKAAIPHLISVARAKPLDDPNKEQTLKMAIARAFQSMGLIAKEALPALEAMAQTDDITLRMVVLEAIKTVRGEK